MKVARPAESGGKLGDYFKRLPITIISLRITTPTRFACHPSKEGGELYLNLQKPPRHQGRTYDPQAGLRALPGAFLPVGQTYPCWSLLILLC